jgi:hypothetical protein
LVNFAGAYPAGAKGQELQTMAYAIQPDSTAAWGLDGRARLLAQVELVHRSRELIVSAFHSLLFRHTVEPDLLRRLRHMEEGLSGARSGARAAVFLKLPVQGE